MEKIFLRGATKDDIYFVFDLANDSACRNNSLQPKEITFEEHEKWMQGILYSETRKLYILMEGDKPIGQGRLELNGDECRLSYSIIPERRGCGYGKLLLKLLNNAILSAFPHCAYSYGEVLQHNIASQKIFEELGYKVEKQGDIYCYRRALSTLN